MDLEMLIHQLIKVAANGGRLDAIIEVTTDKPGFQRSYKVKEVWQGERSTRIIVQPMEEE